jgi:hypothetical protein
MTLGKVGQDLMLDSYLIKLHLPGYVSFTALSYLIGMKGGLTEFLPKLSKFKRSKEKKYYF